jgi:hypothetical protein
MKHPHAEVATRWLNDTSLVILKKSSTSVWHKNPSQHYPDWYVTCDYFLVPKCHVEVALAGLNGAKVERLHESEFGSPDNYWYDYTVTLKHSRFEEESMFRIKPETKQVKIWIGTRQGDTPGYFEVFKGELTELTDHYRDKYLWTEVTVEQVV